MKEISGPPRRPDADERGRRPLPLAVRVLVIIVGVVSTLAALFTGWWPGLAVAAVVYATALAWRWRVDGAFPLKRSLFVLAGLVALTALYWVVWSALWAQPHVAVDITATDCGAAGLGHAVQASVTDGQGAVVATASPDVEPVGPSGCRVHVSLDVPFESSYVLRIGTAFNRSVTVAGTTTDWRDGGRLASTATGQELSWTIHWWRG